MKVKVIKKFRDKESKVINHPGDNLDVSEERFNELVAAGDYVEAVEDDEEPGAGKELEKPTPDPEEDNNENPGADKETVKAILDPVQDDNEDPGAGKEPEKPTPDPEEDSNEEPVPETKNTTKRRAGRKPSAKN